MGSIFDKKFSFCDATKIDRHFSIIFREKIAKKHSIFQQSRKIELYESTNQFKNLKIWLFFSFWVSVFFRYTSFSGVKKNTSTGTFSSMIPSLGEYQKAQLLLNFFYVATLFSPKFKAQKFHLGFNQKPCKNIRILNSKIDVFVPLGYDPDVPKFPK